MVPVGKIVLYGVGLMNGSLGLALRARSFAGEVVGCGRREESLRQALERGAIDRYSLDPADALDGADVVVVGTPVDRVAGTVAELADHSPARCVFTDVGSVKASIVAACAVRAPQARFVGSHPIAGSEKAGVGAARESLFQGSTCVVTTSPDADAWALVCALWEFVGCRVVEMSPEAHDELLAASSHLPHIAAAALVHVVAGTEADARRALDFVGQGFRDTTRIASGSPDVWTSIVTHNAAPLVRLIRGLADELQRIADAVTAQDHDLIHAWLASAREARESLSP